MKIISGGSRFGMGWDRALTDVVCRRAGEMDGEIRRMKIASARESDSGLVWAERGPCLGCKCRPVFLLLKSMVVVVEGEQERLTQRILLG